MHRACSPVSVSAWSSCAATRSRRASFRIDSTRTTIPSSRYRLAEPLGYWNALGLLATLGLLVVAGFVAHARRVAPALVAAAAVPVLATTLYFTFSRGAWAALVLGFAVAVCLDPRRLRLIWVTLVVAVPAVVCVAYASRLDALTTEDALPAAAHVPGAPARRRRRQLPPSRPRSRRLPPEPSARRARRVPTFASSVRRRARRPRRRDRRCRLSSPSEAPASAFDELEPTLQRRPRGRSRSQRSALQRLRERQERAASRRVGRGPRASVRRARLGNVRVPLVRATSQPARRSRRALALHGDVRRGGPRRAGAPRVRTPRACGRRSPRASPAFRRDGCRRARRLGRGQRLRLALGDGRCHADRPPRRRRGLVASERGASRGLGLRARDAASRGQACC